MSKIAISLKVCKPNLSENIEILQSDWQNLFENVPIDDIGAWWASERAFIMIEVRVRVFLLSIRQILLLWNAMILVRVVVHEPEQFGEVNLFYYTEIMDIQLFNEGVTVVCNFEQKAYNGQGFLILLPVFDASYNLVNDMHF